MNTELEEKMQEAANNASNGALCVGCAYMNWEGHSCLDCRGTKMQQEFFLAGTSAMYSELAPLVEWVSVEDRLPEVGEIVILKYKNGQIDFCKYGWAKSMSEAYKDVLTSWRRIEL